MLLSYCYFQYFQARSVQAPFIWTRETSYDMYPLLLNSFLSHVTAVEKGISVKFLPSVFSVLTSCAGFVWDRFNFLSTPTTLGCIVVRVTFIQYLDFSPFSFRKWLGWKYVFQFCKYVISDCWCSLWCRVF